MIKKSEVYNAVKQANEKLLALPLGQTIPVEPFDICLFEPNLGHIFWANITAVEKVTEICVSLIGTTDGDEEDLFDLGQMDDETDVLTVWEAVEKAK